MNGGNINIAQAQQLMVSIPMEDILPRRRWPINMGANWVSVPLRFKPQIRQWLRPADSVEKVAVFFERVTATN
ncbi:hypothetical protein A1507_17580 [Methylomonas koyamae]|uniref:Uncharacterized protein n=1 Tax=Methylomonas koyamae TaxID=702114 RepID=A0A177N7R3_9GAMM|nr:hypothetical protein A1507_17580 [Methylomonas koyamae]